MAERIPQTIEELKVWYAQQKLPPREVTRFFIGLNMQEPRAFGVYRTGDEFVTYKNKADGTRAIRYQGPDEAHAVRELYLRLQQEMVNQGWRPYRFVTDDRATPYAEDVDKEKLVRQAKKRVRGDRIRARLLRIGAWIVAIILGVLLINQLDRVDRAYRANHPSSSSSWDVDGTVDFDSDYDSGSWDSGATDWSSDW